MTAATPGGWEEGPRGTSNRIAGDGRGPRTFSEMTERSIRDVAGRQSRIPSKGDRIAQRRTGISRTGVVWYADQLQVLIKWDDGNSSSLRLAEADFDVLADVPSRDGDRSRERPGRETPHRDAVLNEALSS